MYCDEKQSDTWRSNGNQMCSGVCVVLVVLVVLSSSC